MKVATEQAEVDVRTEDGQELNWRQENMVATILHSFHNVGDDEFVVFVCLACRSIATAPDARTRDITAENYDLTCCAKSTTVVFHTVLI